MLLEIGLLGSYTNPNSQHQHFKSQSWSGVMWDLRFRSKVCCLMRVLNLFFFDIFVNLGRRGGAPQCSRILRDGATASGGEGKDAKPVESPHVGDERRRFLDVIIIHRNTFIYSIIHSSHRFRTFATVRAQNHPWLVSSNFLPKFELPI